MLHKLPIDTEKREFRKKFEPMIVAATVVATSATYSTVEISSADGFYKGSSS